MRTGTPNFTCQSAACRYYGPYGYSSDDVARKLRQKEIYIGRPDVPPGHVLGIDRAEGRYWIEDGK
jgi:hypothetical protein